jgi:glycosyltransferase involved in cell wall biosynthesis
MRVIPPGVEKASVGQGETPRSPPPTVHSLPPAARYLLCIGPLEPCKGFFDAIWALDVIRRVYPDLHLVLAGSGSDRPRLQRFVAQISLGNSVHFVGAQEDLAGLVAGAVAVWIPSRADAGRQVALEALAAGRPVLASRQPGLEEVVADGETGVLVPAGNQAALARQTRLLLDDPARGQALGAAGRESVGRRFPATAFVTAYAGLYHELAA